MAAPQSNHRRSRHEVSPHEGVILASRVQPFGVDTRAVAQVAPASVPASSEAGAFVVPFLSFSILPFAGSSAGSPGLVASPERHETGERKILNGGKPGARPGNLTARSRNAY